MRTKQRTLRLALAVLLAGTAMGSAVQAQNTRNRAAQTQYVALSLCNKTSGKIFVALSYPQSPGSGDWVVEGWKNIDAHSCFDISVPNDSYVYDYAEEDGSNGVWGDDDIKLCVEHPGPFRRINRSDFTCDEDDLAGFSEVDVSGLSSKTINFNP